MITINEANNIEDNINKSIKEYLKKNLKIEIKYNQPVGLCDGLIKVILKLNGEIISSDEHKIYKTFF